MRPKLPPRLCPPPELAEARFGFEDSEKPALRLNGAASTGRSTGSTWAPPARRSSRLQIGGEGRRRQADAREGSSSCSSTRWPRASSGGSSWRAALTGRRRPKRPGPPAEGPPSQGAQGRAGRIGPRPGDHADDEAFESPSRRPAPSPRRSSPRSRPATSAAARSEAPAPPTAPISRSAGASAGPRRRSPNPRRRARNERPDRAEAGGGLPSGAATSSSAPEREPARPPFWSTASAPRLATRTPGATAFTFTERAADQLRRR